MVSYGKMARGMAPAHARTHVAGAFGTERASRDPIRENSRARQHVCDKRADAALRVVAASSHLRVMQAHMLAEAETFFAKSKTTQDPVRARAYLKIAQAIAQEVARTAI